MTTETGSPAGQESAVSLPADAPESFNSVSEAAAYLAELQEKRSKEPAAERAEPATAEPELAQANADPEEAPGEEPEANEPAEQPPIDPPRSWTQAEKDRFQSLPRETQEYLSHREQERETAFRRSQNEIAEQRKAIQAERETAEKVRQQYEAKLPAVEQAVQDFLASQYSDIKTMADVERMAQEDPFRKIQWDTHQQKIAGVLQEAQAAKARQAQESQTQWNEHIQKENELAADFIPELADKAKGPALIKRVSDELLPELGFKTGELNDLASGKSKLSIYDHRVQRLLADALKLRDIQAAPKAVAAKPLPPVQRPGTSKPAGADTSERIQALNRKSELSVKEATELYMLQSRPRKAS